MNSLSRGLRRFVSKLNGKNKIIFFIVLLLICVVSICIAIYSQYFYKYSDTDPLMLGIHIGENKTQEEYIDLKYNFDALFTNELHNKNGDNVNVDKAYTNKEIVYTAYPYQNEDENYYYININLPFLNINNDVAKSINSDIVERFRDKAKNIESLKESNEYIIYQVDYVAYLNQGAVSIAIKEKEKKGSSAETVNVKTYNYSIPDKKEIKLEDLIKLKNTNVEKVQTLIDSSIRASVEHASEIAKQYGATFVRNPNDKMYKVDNTNTYFLTDEGYVYIVYTYGEKSQTNEVDIVIF